MHSLHKESYFLKYNKENIATDLIQSEKHLQKLHEGPIEGGHANCVVKHTLDAAGESGEATSHALIVHGSERSQKFKALGDNIHAFRENLMEKKPTRDEAILGIRKLKRQFESFNPEFDVSKCESCGSIEGVLKHTNNIENHTPTIEDPREEKVLNTQPTNKEDSEPNMVKNIAVVYGANFAGKLIDEVVKPQLTSNYDLPIVLGLSIGLPLIAKVAKLKNGLATGLTTVGAYESTNLLDIAKAYMAPTTVRARVTTQRGTYNVTARNGNVVASRAPVSSVSKYVVTA